MIVLLLILSAFCVNAQNCRTEIFFASQNLIPRWALLDFGSYGLTNADCDDASYPIVHLCCGNGYANAQPTLSACSLATFPSTQCIMVVTGWYGCIEITNLFSETGYICHGSETVEQYSTSKIVRCECSISNFALDATIVVSTAPTLTPTMAPTATPTLSLAPTVEPTFSPATIPPTVAPSLSLALNSSPPSSMPSSAPSFAIRWEQGSVSDKRRSRKGGLCDNMCSSHGICEININCNCFVGLDNEPLWTGPDCSLRACPKGFAWVGSVVSANNMHPEVECSNKGICNYRTGVCNCFPGYDVVACQRSSCPENCNGRGECWPEKLLASKADRKYDLPWDAMKAVGCFCDVGYRGSACEFQECPSGSDPVNGYGAEAGRDCSGRGICNYETGICSCFSGFAGMRCEVQSTNS